MTAVLRHCLRLAAMAAVLAAAVCQRTAPAATASDDDGAATRGPVIARISAAAAKTVGIDVARAGPASIREQLPLYGAVKPNAERVREVIARFPGTLKSVSKAIGDPVGKGETLATIESDESLQTYAVTAPMTGVITAREADPGEQAGSEVLFSITDLSSVWVELSLFPADAARVRAGQAVRVTSVDGRISGDGRIALVGALGQAATQTLTARVPLANDDRRWTPGLFVNGAVALSETAVSVAVAATAVQTLDGESVVFVPVDGGYAARSVRLGRSDGEAIEVLAGLAAGEAYVARNSFIVKAELGKKGLEEDDESGGPAAADDEVPAPASGDKSP